MLSWISNGSKAGKKAAQKIQIIKWPSLGVPEESLTGSTEKRDMKIIVEKMELTNMSVTQTDQLI